MKEDILNRSIGGIDDKLLENAYSGEKRVCLDIISLEQQKYLQAIWLLKCIGNIDYNLVIKAEKPVRKRF